MTEAFRSNTSKWVSRGISIASLIITIALALYQNSTILYYHFNMPQHEGIQQGTITVGNAGFKQATSIQIEIDPDHKLKIHSIGDYSRGQAVIAHNIEGRILYEIPQLYQGQTAEFRFSYEVNSASKFGESDILVQSNEQRGMALSGLFQLLEQVNTIFLISISITIFFGIWAIVNGFWNYFDIRKTRK